MQDKNKIIGGEFGIDIQLLKERRADNLELEKTSTFSSGRSALYHILLDARKDYGVSKVLFPDYLCSSLLVAAKAANFEVKHYSINSALELEKSSFANIYDANCAVLIINYFGLKDLSSQIAAIRSINENAIIIEDDVQAYYEFLKPLNNTTYKFTSLRKTFPCPDGGLAKAANALEEPAATNRFYQYKLAGGVLKSLRRPEFFDDNVYLSLFKMGEDRINSDITMGMSGVSYEILSKIDGSHIGAARKRNARVIADGLKSLGISTVIPVSDHNIPLFVPIYLEDRDKVRACMMRHGVFCPVHWPLDGMSVKKGKEMSEHELSIIIDQRYTNRDMEYILELIEKSLK